jgi:hypothetical protein
VRRFERSLCVSRGVGEGLRCMNATLPDAVRPLLVDAVDGGEWVDVIVLSPADSIPLEVAWLSRETMRQPGSSGY